MCKDNVNGVNTPKIQKAKTAFLQMVQYGNPATKPFKTVTDAVNYSMPFLYGAKMFNKTYGLIPMHGNKAMGFYKAWEENSLNTLGDGIATALAKAALVSGCEGFYVMINNVEPIDELFAPDSLTILEFTELHSKLFYLFDGCPLIDFVLVDQNENFYSFAERRFIIDFNAHKLD